LTIAAIGRHTLPQGSEPVGALVDRYKPIRQAFKLSYPGRIDDDIFLLDLANISAERMFAAVDSNRAYLRQWLPWLDLNTAVEDSEAFIRRERKRAEDGVGLIRAIEYRSELCGIVGFNWIDPVNRACEIGYWLSEDRQGRGIMTRSVQAFIEYAFATRALNRITIPVAVENDKSRAIPEGLGFAQEGIRREAEWLYDHYVDHVVYALLRKNWDE